MKLTLIGIALALVALYFIYELLKASKDKPLDNTAPPIDEWEQVYTKEQNDNAW